MQSENRRIKRYLLCRSKKGKLRSAPKELDYLDNIGVPYKYKAIAAMSSFYNVFSGCLKNGFPLYAPWLPYNAWAFYPFFFIKKGVTLDNIRSLVNHERIHIRQQRELHLLVSLPLLVFAAVGEHLSLFNPIWVLLVVPFVPSIFYLMDIFRVVILAAMNGDRLSFSSLRRKTTFEKEATLCSYETNYLCSRKPFSFIKYMHYDK